MGGENIIQTVLSREFKGSSPRGRGKRPHGPDASARDGLIPAWAGKTAGHAGRAETSRAHPRVGGENHLRCHAVVLRRGLIPAWAGKTSWPAIVFRVIRAHPRVGGENELSAGSPGSTEGSSPRGRGKPAAIRVARDAMGLIPAWAGKTVRRERHEETEQAHPRVGGENRSRRYAISAAAGSSPRGRGKPEDEFVARLGDRLIPAWAGKTRARPAPGGGSRAHPRVGGENR